MNQNASGPTPGRLTAEPEFEKFLRGIAALRRLQAANKMAMLQEDREERVGGTVPGGLITPRDLVEAVKANHEFKPADEVEDGKEEEREKGKGDPIELTVSGQARNLLNHPNLASPVGNLSSSLFGQTVALVGGGGGNSASGNRRVELQLKLSF